jgi:hypothetical protein
MLLIDLSMVVTTTFISDDVALYNQHQRVLGRSFV